MALVQRSGSPRAGKARRLESAERTARVLPVSLLLGAGVLLALVVPVVAFFIFALVTAAVTRRPAVAGGLAVVLATCLFAVSNASKVVAGDWVWYTEHYRILQFTPLQDYLGVRIGWITPAPTEPLYYLASSIVSRISGADPTALALVVTAMTYLPLGIAVVIIATRFTRRVSVVFIAVTLAMCGGLTFTLSTQLVRQEIAAGWVALGLALFFTKRPLVAVPVFAVAILCHNSAAIPACAALVGLALSRLSARPWLWAVLSFCGFVGLGILYLRVEGSNYQGASDGSVGILVIAADIVLAAALLFSLSKIGSPALVAISVFTISMFGFIVGVAAEPLPLLRMYFYIEVARAVAICVLTVLLLRRIRVSPLLVPGAVLAGLLYVQLRIADSPFVYALSPLDVLLFSPLGG